MKLNNNTILIKSNIKSHLNEEMHFNSLPKFVVNVEIFSYLNAKELSLFSQTCHSLNDMFFLNDKLNLSSSYIIRGSFTTYNLTAKQMIQIYTSSQPNELLKLEFRSLTNRLESATQVGNKEMLTVLLKKCHDINMIISGRTLLHIASTMDHENIVDLLIHLGANVNIKSRAQLAPLHCTSSKIIIQKLLTAGANINVRDRLGRTPLHNAIRRDNFEHVEVFVLAGSDLNALDTYGRSPIDEAIRLNRRKIFNFLMKTQRVGMLIATQRWYFNLEKIQNCWDMINPFRS